MLVSIDYLEVTLLKTVEQIFEHFFVNVVQFSNS